MRCKTIKIKAWNAAHSTAMGKFHNAEIDSFGHKLFVHDLIRGSLGARKVSFASTELTRELTGMEIGGVTPLCLPTGLPIWIDAAVMDCEYIVLGGGNRSSKIKADPQILLLQDDVEVAPELAKII